MSRLRDWLVEPSVRGLDPNTVDFTAAHREVLQRKPVLRRLFERFYRECRALDETHFGAARGRRLELGSGSSFCKRLFPDLITSDLKPLPSVDLVARAESLPFPDRGLRAIYAINVFHHLADPRAFFRELLRVLASGGGVVLIEPYHGPLARFLFKRLHASETFDTAVAGWEAERPAGAMSNANQALSFVVFVRDRAIFEREFPELEIVHARPHTHLMYLFSGGLNFRQLVPSWAGGLLGALEWLLTPLNPWLALQHTLVLRRRAEGWTVPETLG